VGEPANVRENNKIEDMNIKKIYCFIKENALSLNRFYQLLRQEKTLLLCLWLHLLCESI